MVLRGMIAMACALLLAGAGGTALAAEVERDSNTLQRWWGKSNAEQAVNKKKALEDSIAQIANPSNSELQEKAIFHLEMLGEDAVPALMEMITAPDGTVKPRARMDAIYAAGRIGPAAAPAVPGITRMLQDENPDNRAIAASALGRIGKPAGSSVSVLTALLNDSSPFVKESAFHALRSIGTPAARKALEGYKTVAN